MSHKQLLRAPIGTTGLQVEWCGDVYAIAANFSQASGSILSWSPSRNDWISTGMQVADFRHSMRSALRQEIEQAIIAGGELADRDDVDEIVSSACGCLTHELGEMIDMLESHGDKFTGTELRMGVIDTAQGWIDSGFTPESADPWCAIGVWDHDVAAVLRDEDLTPDQVGRAAMRMIADAGDCVGDEYTDADPIHSVCLCDTDIDLLIEECGNE